MERFRCSPECSDGNGCRGGLVGAVKCPGETFMQIVTLWEVAEARVAVTVMAQ